ncbi:MAG: hypothetical protein LQ341_007303, partial [Variospora aurantia]
FDTPLIGGRPSEGFAPSAPSLQHPTSENVKPSCSSGDRCVILSSMSKPVASD